jgi:hypothetical protein
VLRTTTRGWLGYHPHIMAGAEIPGPLGTTDNHGWEHPERRATESAFAVPGLIGSSPWHRALAYSGLAPEPKSTNVQESVPHLKQRARAGIPAITRRIQSWKQGVGAPPYWEGTLRYGATASARNTIYSSMWPQLRPDRGRYWFQGATMVTGAGGIKDMEGGLASLAGKVRVPGTPTTADMAMVIAGNVFLFPYNLQNFFTLRDGGEVIGFEGLRGTELDRGLVALEQTLVQSFLDNHQWPSPAEKTASFDRLSKGFTSFFANQWLKQSVERLFGTRFDFGDIDHRIRLGFDVVDRLRNGT